MGSRTVQNTVRKADIHATVQAGVQFGPHSSHPAVGRSLFSQTHGVHRISQNGNQFDILKLYLIQ